MPQLKPVSRDEFFAALYAETRDIMPVIVNNTYPYAQEWRNQNSSARELFGRSCDGRWELVAQ